MNVDSLRASFSRLFSSEEISKFCVGIAQEMYVVASQFFVTRRQGQIKGHIGISLVCCC